MLIEPNFFIYYTISSQLFIIKASSFVKHILNFLVVYRNMITSHFIFIISLGCVIFQTGFHLRLCPITALILRLNRSISKQHRNMKNEYSELANYLLHFFLFFSFSYPKQKDFFKLNQLVFEVSAFNQTSSFVLSN